MVVVVVVVVVVVGITSSSSGGGGGGGGGSSNNSSRVYYFLYIYLFTAIGLLPGGSGYFTCKQNMKLVTTIFKSEGLHEKHVVATWNLGNHLSIC